MNQPPANGCSSWSTNDSVQLYSIDRWGNGLFSINDQGDLLVGTSVDPASQWNLHEIIKECEKRDFAPPFLVRFTPIIKQRLCELNNAFNGAIEEFQFNGCYQCVYPVKVNQHREVIEAFANAARRVGGGLEAGSKAELLAVIALSDNTIPVLCNGFKDERTVEMALRAIGIGRQVTIILENTDEIHLVACVSRRLAIRPKLGLRVKLAARSSGRWSSSVGSSSKFGLTSIELSRAIQLLRRHEMLDECHLLHFHPGSQINSIRKIKECIIEATRIFAALVRQRIPIKTIDVGGGLAVDYTGNKNTHPSSTNYTLQEYANDVVYYIQMVCDQEQVPHPDIISESGRALVAHHSILVVPVISTSSPADPTISTAAANPNLPLTAEKNPLESSAGEQALPLIELREIAKELDERNMQECFHDAQQAMEMAQQLFINGHLSLEQRMNAEELFSRICLQIYGCLNKLDFVPAELAELKHMFAETYLGNFSVFQALPDHWAINQLFPVMPIHRLNQRPDRVGVIADITCDSDGKIECFLGAHPSAPTLPLHQFNRDQPYWLGVFLVGAYQEALSDDHNLFGKFHVVTIDESADWRNGIDVMRGSDLKDVLQHVHHDFDAILGAIDASSHAAAELGMVSQAQLKQTLKFFRDCSSDYTYLAGTDSAQAIDTLDISHTGHANTPSPIHLVDKKIGTG